ncbi:hypothetical protein KC845_00020 [Candidatus Kaiserbacteria bacterium]|nr:hypothetical protein [Candidatus Kaiserbacteria bacterium]
MANTARQLVNKGRPHNVKVATKGSTTSAPLAKKGTSPYDPNRRFKAGSNVIDFNKAKEQRDSLKKSAVDSGYLVSSHKTIGPYAQPTNVNLQYKLPNESTGSKILQKSQAKKIQNNQILNQTDVQSVNQPNQINQPPIINEPELASPPKTRKIKLKNNQSSLDLAYRSKVVWTTWILVSTAMSIWWLQALFFGGGLAITSLGLLATSIVDYVGNIPILGDFLSFVTDYATEYGLEVTAGAMAATSALILVFGIMTMFGCWFVYKIRFIDSMNGVMGVFFLFCLGLYAVPIVNFFPWAVVWLIVVGMLSKRGV